MSPAAETPSAALRPTPSAAPAPVAEPVPLSALVERSPQGWSPQRIRNEVGLAMRRGKLQLSKAQLAEADALVAEGMSPASAVRLIARRGSE